jgi:hypothetical protein
MCLKFYSANVPAHLFRSNGARNISNPISRARIISTKFGTIPAETGFAPKNEIPAMAARQPLTHANSNTLKAQRKLA